MSGITHTQPQSVRSPRSTRLRRAAIVAAVVAAFALAAVLALALGDGGPSTAPAPQTATQTLGGPGVGPMGIRYDGGPEEGSWRAIPANPGRPDGGPEEGTRGPGH